MSKSLGPCPAAARPSIRTGCDIERCPLGHSAKNQERWQRSGPAHRLFASSLRILFGFSKI